MKDNQKNSMFLKIQQIKQLKMNTNRINQKPSKQLTQPFIRILNIIYELQPPIDKINLIQLQGNIEQALKQINISKQEQKSIKLKFYSKIVTSCILQNNYTQSYLYFNKLQNLMDCSLDVSKTIYFLFGLKSLSALKNYNFNQNIQYKQAQKAQLIFFYILSLLNQIHSQYYTKKCQAIISTYSQKEFQSNLQSFILATIKNKQSNKLVKDFIKRLIELQQRYSSYIPNQITNKMNFMKREILQIMNFCKIFNKSSATQKNFDVFQCLKICSQQNNPYVLNAILQTPYIKTLKEKCLQYKKEAEKMSKIAKLNERGQNLKNYNIEKYNICKNGAVLKKCNYENSNKQIKFVLLKEDGVYWGKQSTSVKLKHKWDDIKGIFYGKITKNAVQKLKEQKGNQIFSFITPQRSVDFICGSCQEARNWVEGLSYALNKYNELHNKQQPRLMVTQGKQLWRNVFIKLKQDNKEWILKVLGEQQIFKPQQKIYEKDN